MQLRIALALMLFATSLEAANLTFPGARWQQADPATLGWSVPRLEEARGYHQSIGPSAVMIVHRGNLVAAWGDVDRRQAVQSVRKSLLSALIGIAAAEGRIDLDASLERLGIDDRPPLTAEERKATVAHLLTSRSGIYHSALYEHPSWKRRKPARGTHAPGQEWFYNNWDFNALGTIYERGVGSAVGEAFASRIAGPTGMEDFRPRDVTYLTRRSLTERFMKNESDHRAYVFHVSARDMARFGLLYLANGRWNGRQVVPEEWVRESMRPIVDLGRRGGYGYMWWIRPQSESAPAMAYASGAGGHRIAIIPSLELVVVHQVPTGGVGLLSQLRRRFFGGPSVDDDQLAELLKKIVAAHPGRNE